MALYAAHISDQAINPQTGKRLPGESCVNAKNPQKEVVWQSDGGYKREMKSCFIFEGYYDRWKYSPSAKRVAGVSA
ncbi:hypothetical protein NUBL17187_19230 [Klebsiella michiganensis]|nr:hypothetical protein TUM17563_17110 [Klebsiella oxytoca]GKQ20713.1 hypothetical protein NUBL21980_39300 [Klebsiella michiganensis]GKQ24127.1 hypothetical protein NUBL17187_19230 [Klebsiella michiganensis]